MTVSMMTKYLSRKFDMTEREKNDWYVEPVECTRALIKVEEIYGGLGNTILDPCCGQGNILNTLYEHGYHNVEGGDIEDRGTEQPVSSNVIFLSMIMKSGGIASYPIRHTSMLKRWHGKR